MFGFLFYFLPSSGLGFSLFSSFFGFGFLFPSPGLFFLLFFSFLRFSFFLSFSEFACLKKWHLCVSFYFSFSGFGFLFYVSFVFTAIMNLFLSLVWCNDRRLTFLVEFLFPFFCEFSCFTSSSCDLTFMLNYCFCLFNSSFIPSFSLFFSPIFISFFLSVFSPFFHSSVRFCKIIRYNIII